MFWWYFEYLNRFVQNWYDVGHETYTPLAYTVHATLAFSTVLPAVTSTMDLLSTYAALNHTRLRKPLVARHGRAYAGFVLSLAAFGLAGIAVWSDYLYPLVWVASLCVLVSLQILLGQETVLSKLAQGPLASGGPIGHGGVGMWPLLGNVELLQLREVGLRDSSRAALASFRDARVRLRGLSAVWVSMLGSG